MPAFLLPGESRTRLIISGLRPRLALSALRPWRRYANGETEKVSGA